nr:hypothetical protein [uncultured Cohaesibacter sp.]
MLLSEKERASIRHRLRIGNSVKQIALAYTGLEGIREEIEDIKAQMNGTSRWPTLALRAPVCEPQRRAGKTATFQEGKEGWFRNLRLDLRMLVREVCDYHSITLLELMTGRNAKLARQMLCHALHRRWAMSYEEIAALLAIHPATVSNYANAWSGKKPIAEPPLPSMPKEVLLVALAIAGEHGVTCCALLKSAGRRGLCDRARNHFTYRLYTECGFTKQDIARVFGCDHTNIKGYLASYIKAKELDPEWVESQHKLLAQSRYGKHFRPTIAAE